MSLNMREFDDRLSCYELSRQVMGNHVPLDNVRLELTPSRFYLLPYHHLEVAEFESAHKGDTISLSFVNHKVRITGRNLRDSGRCFSGTRRRVGHARAGKVRGCVGKCAGLG